MFGLQSRLNFYHSLLKNVRFTESSSQFLSQFTKLLPSELVKNLTKTQNTDFDDLIKFYEDDLPSSKGFPAELELWKTIGHQNHARLMQNH